MDSVIVFFRGAAHEDIERSALAYGYAGESVWDGEDQFYLYRYGERDLFSEYDATEKEDVIGVLEGAPTCAFQVAARHGTSARRALEVLGHLASLFPHCVVDDDRGSLFSGEYVARRAKEKPSGGVFALGEG